MKTADQLLEQARRKLVKRLKKRVERMSIEELCFHLEAERDMREWVDQGMTPVLTTLFFRMMKRVEDSPTTHSFISKTFYSCGQPKGPDARRLMKSPHQRVRMDLAHIDDVLGLTADFKDQREKEAKALGPDPMLIESVPTDLPDDAPPEDQLRFAEAECREAHRQYRAGEDGPKCH